MQRILPPPQQFASQTLTDTRFREKRSSHEHHENRWILPHTLHCPDNHITPHLKQHLFTATQKHKDAMVRSSQWCGMLCCSLSWPKFQRSRPTDPIRPTASHPDDIRFNSALAEVGPFWAMQPQ